jgi:OOP family OmpA-OmpF porin
MKKVLPTTALSLAIFAATPAFANEGWYAGIGFGQAETSDWLSDDDALGALGAVGNSVGVVSFTGSISADSDDSDSAWKIFGGYQFNQYLGAELTYIDLGENTAESEAVGIFDIGFGGFPGGIGVKFTGETQALIVDAVGRYDFNSRFGIFGKAGAYHARSELKATVTFSDPSGSSSGSDSIDDNNVGIHFGVGAQFNFTENVAVRAEWERLSDVELEDAESDIDVMSISAVYKF